MHSDSWILIAGNEKLPREYLPTCIGLETWHDGRTRITRKSCEVVEERRDYTCASLTIFNYFVTCIIRANFMKKIQSIWAHVLLVHQWTTSTIDTWIECNREVWALEPASHLSVDNSEIFFRSPNCKTMKEATINQWLCDVNFWFNYERYHIFLNGLLERVGQLNHKICLTHNLMLFLFLFSFPSIKAFPPMPFFILVGQNFWYNM